MSISRVFKRSLIYTLITVLALPAVLITSILTAPKASAYDGTGTIPRVIINEFVSDPNTGENEWVELLNTTSSSIDLAGWSLEDLAGNSKSLSALSTITAEGFVVLESSSAWLNNSGDSIYLYDSSSILVDSIVYGGVDVPSKGKSNAYINGAWEYDLAPTKDAANLPVDVTAPIITIGTYSTALTNQNITVTATTNEGELNASSYTFTENDSFEFVATDVAGNVSRETVTITNIDKTAPVITPIADVIATEEVTVKIDATDTNLPLTYELSQGYGPDALIFTRDAVDPSIFKISADVNSADYYIYATATDAAGNSSVTTFNLAWNAPYNITPANPILKFNLIEGSANGTGFGEIIVDPTVVNPMIDFSDLMETITNDDGQVIKRVVLQDFALTIRSVVNEIPVTIEFGTTNPEAVESDVFITGSTAWDGKISLPTLASLENVVLPVGATYSASDILPIMIGDLGGNLNFAGFVKITFGGQVGRIAGFVKDNKFVEIAATCGVDAIGDLVLPETTPVTNECKAVSADGKDLIILTNHFTTFATYKDLVPHVTVVKSDIDGVKKVTVSWPSTGADSYEVKVGGNTYVITAIVGKTDYSYDAKATGAGDYNISVTAIYGNDRVVSRITSVSFVAPTVDVVVEETPAPASAPQKTLTAKPAPAQAEEKVAEDKGVIKADEDKADDDINWTPWIVLFIMIILAGAATGGYFWWFSGQEDAKTVVKEASSKIETKKTPKTQTIAKTTDKKKTKRW